VAELDAGSHFEPAAEGAQLRVERLPDADGVVTFKVAGQLDISTEGLLREQLQPTVKAAPAKIVLDFSDLTFMDSSGLAVLLVAAQEVPSVEVRNPTQIIRRLITIAGLNESLPMVPDA
jgi:anti-sigma B factor antagonist